MGKAQSKRSVDITTDNKKGVEEEITEKLEKIEDVDKKDINGDANIPSSSEDSHVEMENVKDITTEKKGDVEDVGLAPDDIKSPALETSKEDGTIEDVSPLSEENSKKTKKEKVKKKWSFRSISFGKKDKQKPGKTDGSLENVTGAVNGSENDKNTDSVKSQETLPNSNSQEVDGFHENGNTTETQTNGDEIKENEETELKESTDKKKGASANDTTVLKTSQESEESTEINSKTVSLHEDEETNTIKDEICNVPEEVERIEKQSAFKDTAENKGIPANEANSLNGIVDENHQNGTNEVCEEEKQSNPQIEVINNPGNKVSADTLKSNSSSTSTIPSIDQTNVIVLNETNNDVEVESNASNKVFVNLKESEQTYDLKELVKTDNLTSEKLVDEFSVPPLPISPPPSQVSVFAFTSNNEQVNSIEKNENNLTEAIAETRYEEVVENKHNIADESEKTVGESIEFTGYEESSEKGILEKKSNEEYTDRTVQVQLVEENKECNNFAELQEGSNDIGNNNEQGGLIFEKKETMETTTVNDVTPMLKKSNVDFQEERSSIGITETFDDCKVNQEVIISDGITVIESDPIFLEMRSSEVLEEKHAVPDDINTFSSDTEDIVADESKELSTPIDLKECATEAELKQDTSVSCD
ncbi:A-kinase anchor protein 200 isoform X2 [Musca domestica]|uniref:A-kinase anchor protein 200 isoform X2 n=1 Tax=Musca domestica TaxID=7370 RepID=A0A9J7IBY4_MUSDO|nr:A-kinase anchor protein 200 isoform X2 [Musca domestica]